MSGGGDNNTLNYIKNEDVAMAPYDHKLVPEKEQMIGGLVSMV